MASDKAAGGRLAIGRLGAPRGVRGDLKVHSYSGEWEHFLRLKEVDLEAEGRTLHLKVARIEESAGALSMAFEGYASPEAARALTGLDIMVDRKDAAPLGENEWYAVDLIGLDLRSEGSRLATVRSVIEGGSEPWLEALLPDGRLCLVPFRKEFVGEVDIAGRSIELIAPWLLE
jgi:16S rRNA processing protein RimM